MRTPHVVPATLELAAQIAPRLREFDTPELLTEPVAFVQRVVADSPGALAWIMDGEPAALFGVIPGNLAAGTGTLWVVTTDAICADVRTFWKGSQAYLAAMLRRYVSLDAYVDDRFTASVRWLTKLGFTLDPQVHYAPGGIPFRHGRKER